MACLNEEEEKKKLLPLAATPMASAPSASLALIPPAPPPSATTPMASAHSAPLAIMPPAPPSLDGYLRNHVHPRTDCAKCIVACGADASVRESFASNGGKGRARDVSRKHACPLAAHAISASRDGVTLVEQYERDHGIKLPNKKQKFQESMRNTFGVEPLGKPPSYKVTLYTPPRVDASLALEGGAVKLCLVSFGYEPTSKQGTKDNYMGFTID